MHDTTTVVVSRDRQVFGHPVGLVTLFFSEMWERFSYYGMRALLVLFLVDAVSKGGFGLDDRTATAIYGLYTAAVYVVALPGGWIADRLIGTQAAALWGGVIIACGHLLLGFSGTSTAVFYMGLALIIAGTGLLKPNLSALVAQLYPEGGYRRDAGFTIYYMSVNIGAFFGPLLTAWLAQKYGWHYGFFAAAVGMMLGVYVFVRYRGLLHGAGRHPAAPPPGRSAPNARRWLTWIALGFAGIIAVITSGTVPMSPVEVQEASKWVIVGISAAYFIYLFFFAGLRMIDRKRAVMMLILFLACALFWSGFEQAGSSFNLFAERYTVRQAGTFLIPSGWFQSLNPFFIVAFAPLFSALWVTLGARNLDPSAPVKFVFGLLGMALGFLILADSARYVAAGQMVSPMWLVSVYLVHTFGELCLSPVGLSAFTKLAPARLVGQSLGVWFLGTSLGQLIAGQIAGEFDANNLAAMPGQLMRIFWFGTVSAVVLLIVGTVVHRWIAASRDE